MIEKIKFKGFKAVPWLETSNLWKTHARGGIKFVSGKPNVVIGPNGSGKSALMTALAYLTLSYFSGRSNLDGNFSDTKALWTEGEKWCKDPNPLKGMGI